MPIKNIVLNQLFRRFLKDISIFLFFWVGRKETELLQKLEEWASFGYGQFPHWGIFHRFNLTDNLFSRKSKAKTYKNQTGKAVNHKKHELKSKRHTTSSGSNLVDELLFLFNSLIYRLFSVFRGF